MEGFDTADPSPSVDPWLFSVFPDRELHRPGTASNQFVDYNAVPKTPERPKQTSVADDDTDSATQALQPTVNGVAVAVTPETSRTPPGALDDFLNATGTARGVTIRAVQHPSPGDKSTSTVVCFFLSMRC
jgi:hypothetical protein